MPTRPSLLLAAAVCACAMPTPTAAQAAVTVDRRLLESSNIRRITGKKVTTVSPDAAVLQLKPGEFLAARAPGSAVRLAGGEQRVGWKVPVQLVGATGLGERLSLHPKVFVQEEGLRFRPASGDFQATLLVELADDSMTTGSRPLGRAVQIQLL